MKIVRNPEPSTVELGDCEYADVVTFTPGGTPWLVTRDFVSRIPKDYEHIRPPIILVNLEDGNVGYHEIDTDVYLERNAKLVIE